jgi:hypothetical protein
VERLSCFPVDASGRRLSAVTTVTDMGGLLALWAPYVAAAVALAVGVIAPAVSARTAERTAERTLRVQREIANADRLWHKRAEAYEALLHWSGEIRRATWAARDASAPGSTLALRAYRSVELPMDLQVRLTTYASAAVYDAAYAFASSLGDLVDGWVADLERGSKTRNPDLEDVHVAMATAMAKAVSDDLHDAAASDTARPGEDRGT